MIFLKIMEKNDIKKQPKIKKVLFYTSVRRLFRTTLIGYLYEIAQVYPVVLLSEKLDEETEKVIRNKKLFPKLEKIVPVEQYTGRKMNLFARSKYLSTRRETRAFFEKAFFREKLKRKSNEIYTTKSPETSFFLTIKFILSIFHRILSKFKCSNSRDWLYTKRN